MLEKAKFKGFILTISVSFGIDTSISRGKTKSTTWKKKAYSQISYTTDVKSFSNEGVH